MQPCLPGVVTDTDIGRWQLEQGFHCIGVGVSHVAGGDDPQSGCSGGGPFTESAEFRQQNPYSAPADERPKNVDPVRSRQFLGQLQSQRGIQPGPRQQGIPRQGCIGARRLGPILGSVTPHPQQPLPRTNQLQIGVLVSRQLIPQQAFHALQETLLPFEPFDSRVSCQSPHQQPFERLRQSGVSFGGIEGPGLSLVGQSVSLPVIQQEFINPRRQWTRVKFGISHETS